MWGKKANFVIFFTACGESKSLPRGKGFRVGVT